MCYDKKRRSYLPLFLEVGDAMANFTRNAIKETFIKLLEERPLAEITVKDIVETCGINRNSFYYHFQDIPTLLEEIVMEEAEDIICKYPTINSIVECFDALIEFASHRKRAIMHIFRSVKREVFEHYLMKVSEHFVRAYIETALQGRSIEAHDKDAIIQYYKCVCFGLTIDWLNGGMNEEDVQSVRGIFLVQKNFAVEIADLLQKQKK
jgi:AcrR family transcriptional regulator